MEIKELHMDAKELANTLKAFVLSLAEAIDYDRLQEATLQRLGAITEDQRAGLDEFFLELKNAEITEVDAEDMLATIHAKEMFEELLTDDTNEEPEEDAE